MPRRTVETTADRISCSAETNAKLMRSDEASDRIDCAAGTFATSIGSDEVPETFVETTAPAFCRCSRERRGGALHGVRGRDTPRTASDIGGLCWLQCGHVCRSNEVSDRIDRAAATCISSRKEARTHGTESAAVQRRMEMTAPAVCRCTECAARTRIELHRTSADCVDYSADCVDCSVFTRCGSAEECRGVGPHRPCGSDVHQLSQGSDDAWD